jgi:hypothetical protein
MIPFLGKMSGRIGNPWDKKGGGQRSMMIFSPS